MSFPAYEKYDSYENEWVEELPSGWNYCSLRWKSKIFSGGTPDKSNLSYWTDGTIPWLASGEVNQKFITKPTTYITEEALKNSSAKWVKINSLLMAIAGQGKTKGTISQLGFDSTCNQSMAAIEPQGISSRYLFYWLESNYRNIRGLAGDGLRDGLNLEMLGSIKSPIPSLEEQRQIAAVLDRETAAIDTLIAKQERLIALLQEKRQAVISHAVTPLEGDRVVKLGYLIDLLPGFAFSSETYSQDSNQIKLLRGINVGVGNTKWQEVVYWPKEGSSDLNEFFLQADDVVFGMDRPWISTGPRVARITEEDLPALLVQRVARIRAKKGLNQDYLYLILSSNEFKSFVEADLTGVSVPHISPSQIAEYRFRKLDLQLQKQLVQQVKISCSRIDKTTNKALKSIQLLKERRTALISAAVTGKIDLRNA